MFFRYFEPYGYLNNTHTKEFESISEIASAKLYSLTYWGDYGGDTVSRFHYDTILENAPDLVRSISGNHGNALVLRIGELGESITDKRYSDQHVFLSSFFRWAFTERYDYPIYENAGDYSDWESETIDKVIKEDVSSWLGSDARSLLTSTTRNALADSELEFTDDDVTDAIHDLFYDSEEYPYFESATSVVYPFDHAAIAHRLLENYALTMIPKQETELPIQF